MILTYDLLKSAIDQAEAEGLMVVQVILAHRETRIPLELAYRWLTDLI
jgi:hypothetical protein